MVYIYGKYFILISLVLISTAIFGQCQQSAGVTVIEVKILPVVKLVVINESDKWLFNPSTPGTETREGLLLIRANVPWMLGVKDDDPITRGHMTEWNGLEYGKGKLISPMSVFAETGVVLPEGGMVQSGEKTGGQEIPFYFTQKVSGDDEPLLDNSTYRIVAAFYAVPRF